MAAALDHYHARMQRVLDHIDRHLDGDLDLNAVSGVAAFSKFHFHRQFKATFGLCLHRYVQLARLFRVEAVVYRPRRHPVRTEACRSSLARGSGGRGCTSCADGTSKSESHPVRHSRA
jgi:methylphosphotriester-DNA--protein-cysteine methyltransferase